MSLPECPFKVDDIVVCINPYFCYALKKGQMYIIEKVHKNMVTITDEMNMRHVVNYVAFVYPIREIKYYGEWKLIIFERYGKK